MPNLFNPAVVLIIDDDPFVHQIFRSILKRSITDSLHARNLTEAIEMMKDQVPDLIVLDMLLPQSNFDPETLPQSIRTRFGEEIRFIAMSAYYTEDQGTRERFRKAGYNGYFTKPIQVERVREYIRKVYNQPVTSFTEHN